VRKTLLRVLVVKREYHPVIIQPQVSNCLVVKSCFSYGLSTYVGDNVGGKVTKSPGNEPNLSEARNKTTTTSQGVNPNGDLKLNIFTI
jgi:hypothetical protein